MPRKVPRPPKASTLARRTAIRETDRSIRASLRVGWSPEEVRQVVEAAILMEGGAQ